MIVVTTRRRPSRTASSPPAMLASIPPMPATAITVVGAIKPSRTFWRVMLKLRKATSQDRAANISHIWHM